jgi:hypothetical protein
MAACIAAMRGTASQVADLKKSLCYRSATSSASSKTILTASLSKGRLNGLDIFFPKVNEKGKKVRLKGKSEALAE